MLAVSIIAVGRLRKGPELELIRDYLERAEKTGRGLGIGPCRVVEVEDRKGGGMAGEAEALRRAIPGGAVIVAMDERRAMAVEITVVKLENPDCAINCRISPMAR